jgi:hypothetical protein
MSQLNPATTVTAFPFLPYKYSFPFSFFFFILLALCFIPSSLSFLALPQSQCSPFFPSRLWQKRPVFIILKMPARNKITGQECVMFYVHCAFFLKQTLNRLPTPYWKQHASMLSVYLITLITTKSVLRMLSVLFIGVLRGNLVFSTCSFWTLIDKELFGLLTNVRQRSVPHEALTCCTAINSCTWR